MRFQRVFVGAAAVATFFVLLGFHIGSAQQATVPFSGEQTQERRNRARFPHKSPKHKTLQCASCHQVSGATFEVENYPGHNACITCHNFAEMAVRDFSGYCGTCHTGLPSSKEETKLFPFPKARRQSEFGIDFSHPSHSKPFAPPTKPASGLVAPTAILSSREAGGLVTAKCSDCHSRTPDISAAVAPEMTLPSGHRYCYVCHGETPVKQPSMNECAGCHKLDLPYGKPLYGIVTNFKHHDHEIDIRKRRKGETAARGDDLCVACHQTARNALRLSDLKLPAPSTCRECHNGGLGLPEKLSETVEASLRDR